MQLPSYMVTNVDNCLLSFQPFVILPIGKSLLNGSSLACLISSPTPEFEHGGDDAETHD